MKLIVKRVPIRFHPGGWRRNALMAHLIGDDGRPLCGNPFLKMERWAEVPPEEVAEWEICRKCRRKLEK